MIIDAMNINLEELELARVQFAKDNDADEIDVLEAMIDYFKESSSVEEIVVKLQST